MRISEAFEKRARVDGVNYWCMTDEAQDAMPWLYDACQHAHDGEMPNDWRWETCYYIARDIDDRVSSDYFDADDSPWEIAEMLTDVYNGDLARWLADDQTRGGYVDEIRENMGAECAEDRSLWALVSAGQQYCIEQMARILCDAYQTNVLDTKDEEDAS